MLTRRRDTIAYTLTRSQAMAKTRTHVRTHTGDKALIDTFTHAIMSHSKKRESGAQAGTSSWPPSISHTCTQQQQQQLRESSPGQPGRALMSPTCTSAGRFIARERPIGLQRRRCHVTSLRYLLIDSGASRCATFSRAHCGLFFGDIRTEMCNDLFGQNS